MTPRAFIYLFVFLILSSCNSDIPEHLKPKPNSFGKLNKVVVVSDKEIWEGMVGDTVDYYLGSAYPVLPTPQATFDLRHFTAEEVLGNDLRQQLRTYFIVANLTKEDSKTTQMVKKDLGDQKFQKALTDKKMISSVGTNKWANGQLLIYVFGSSDEEIAQNVKKVVGSATQRIQAHDQDQLEAKAFGGGEHKGLTKILKNKMGIDLKIPYEFQNVPLQDNPDSILWFRKDTKSYTYSLVFKKEKYTDQSQLTKAHMKELRNDFGARFVTTPTEGSFARINDIDLPVFEYDKTINGLFAKEYRGIWEMTKDFSGGPFISYFFLNQEKGEVIWIDGFLFAPGKKKRDTMQELEYIVNQIRWN